MSSYNVRDRIKEMIAVNILKPMLKDHKNKLSALGMVTSENNRYKSLVHCQFTMLEWNVGFEMQRSSINQKSFFSLDVKKK